MTQEQLINQFCEFRGKCTTDDVVALNFAYKMLTPRWISVEDELPPTSDRDDESEDCLIVDEDGDMNVGYYNKMDKTWFSCDGYILGVTHWMPLPAISCSEKPNNHFIDANKKVDRVIGTADHIKTALDVLNKKGGGNENS